MGNNEIIATNEFKLAVFLKIKQLRRNELATLTYSHVLDVLHFLKWKKKPPQSIHEAINDLMDLSIGEIIATLHTLALINGAQMEKNAIEECWRKLND